MRVARDDCMNASFQRQVNNAIDSELGERWYRAQDDPVALLRAESRFRARWITEQMRRFSEERCVVLDVGCGAGFVAIHLAREGYRVVAIDIAASSLAVGRRHDSSGRVLWQLADAAALPFPDGSFDAVCLFDLLEHVERPASVVSAAARVLVPGGLLFISYLQPQLALVASRERKNQLCRERSSERFTVTEGRC